jgi:hypothetical protein
VRAGDLDCRVSAESREPRGSFCCCVDLLGRGPIAALRVSKNTVRLGTVSAKAASVRGFRLFGSAIA